VARTLVPLRRPAILILRAPRSRSLPVDANVRARARRLAHLATLLPYLWEYKVGCRGRGLHRPAKVANVGVPLLLKRIVDAIDPRMRSFLPLLLLVGYGFCACRRRCSPSSAISVAKVLSAPCADGIRCSAPACASLRFHSRADRRPTRTSSAPARHLHADRFCCFSILPTLVEIALVRASDLSLRLDVDRDHRRPRSRLSFFTVMIPSAHEFPPGDELSSTARRQRRDRRLLNYGRSSTSARAWGERYDQSCTLEKGGGEEPDVASALNSAGSITPSPYTDHVARDGGVVNGR